MVGVEGLRKRQRAEPGRGARAEITHRGNRAHAGRGRDHCDDAQARGGDARLAVIFAGWLMSVGLGGQGMNAANRQTGVNQIVLLAVLAVALAAAFLAIDLYTGGEKAMLTFQTPGLHIVSPPPPSKPRPAPYPP